MTTVFHQCNPPIEVVTPLGDGLAMFIMSDVTDQSHMWGVRQLATGECWWWLNHYIRFGQNISIGQPTITPIDAPDGLEKHRARYAALSAGEGKV